MATRPTLKPGAKGAKGTALGDAIFLWRIFVGLPPGKDVTTYDYGTMTVERTKTYQKKNGLTVDGEVGPATWAKYDEQQYGPPAPPVPGATPPAFKEPAVTSPRQPTTPQNPIAAAAAAAAPFLSLPKSAEEAKQQVIKSLNATPLWLRVVGGGISAGVTFLGLKKLFGSK